MSTSGATDGRGMVRRRASVLGVWCAALHFAGGWFIWTRGYRFSGACFVLNGVVLLSFATSLVRNGAPGG